MVVQDVEATLFPASKNTQYVRIILFLLAAFLVSKIAWFWDLRQGPEPRTLVDFDAFYIVAGMIWRGEIEQAYAFATMGQVQKALAGRETFLPWTYPPQFSLLVAPLAFLPIGAAYALFTGGTLAAYLATLRRITGENFALTLLLLFPAFCIMIACGQNGFLTGVLIGLTCWGLQKRHALAGLPLGLMIIKPHLAIAFAVYALAARRWSTVLIAAATVVITSAFTTILLGPGVWTAFLGSLKEARIFLEQGLYPLYRMISPYAALRTLGFPASGAFLGQILAAGLAITLVCVAAWRGFRPRQSLGLTAMASLLISPYAYDYDLPIFGIGLALLLPDIMRLASPRERAAIYGLTFMMGFFGLAQSFRLQVQFGPHAVIGDNMPVSLAGLMLAMLLGLAWRIVRRDARINSDR
jgi:hypothetical protein